MIIKAALKLTAKTFKIKQDFDTFDNSDISNTVFSRGLWECKSNSNGGYIYIILYYYIIFILYYIYSCTRLYM